MSRPCSNCGTPTDASDGICYTNPECKRLAQNAKCRAWYAANREQQQQRVLTWQRNNREKALASHRASRAKKAEWLRSQKIGKSCLDCGLACTIDNFVAFDWDHRPEVEKSFEINRSFHKSRTLEQVLAEIAKCDLRCRNCHAIITHQRRQAA